MREGSLRAPLFLYTYSMSYEAPLGFDGSTADFPDKPSVPETNNYLASNFFQFQLFRTPNISYFTQNVTFPSTTVTPVEIGNSLGRPNQFIGGRYVHDPLVVQFIVDEDMGNYEEIFNWMKKINNYEDRNLVIDGAQVKQFFSDAALLITNSTYNVKKRVMFKNTFPTTLSGFNLSSVLNDNEPVLATVSLIFETYEIEDI
jgi:hypothetical protein